MATSNQSIAPEDGWVKVADDTGFLRLRAYPELPFYVCIKTGAAPTIATKGVLVPAGKSFTVNQPITGDVYVRVTNPIGDKDVRIDIEDESPVAGVLPTGGATAANQATANASLATLANAVGTEYETVAASQSDQVLGATGATGDYISHLIIQPAAVGAGTVTLKDNTTVIFTFTTGALSDLRPIVVPLGIFSTAGAWKVTTGASVAVIGIGNFT